MFYHWNKTTYTETNKRYINASETFVLLLHDSVQFHDNNFQTSRTIIKRFFTDQVAL